MHLTRHYRLDGARYHAVRIRFGTRSPRRSWQPPSVRYSIDKVPFGILKDVRESDDQTTWTSGNLAIPDGATALRVRECPRRGHSRRVGVRAVTEAPMDGRRANGSRRMIEARGHERNREGTAMTLTRRGWARERVEAVQSIRDWDGENTTFEDSVGTAVEAAAVEAAESGSTESLYRAWAALVEVESRGRLRATVPHGGNVIGRGRILDLWDRVGGILSMDAPEWKHARWKHAQRVLSGTVTEIWSGLAEVVGGIEEEDWLDAVYAALENARNLEKAALADLMALADLVARVHEVKRDSSDPGRCSFIGLWRGVVVREAEKAARLADCEGRSGALLSGHGQVRFRPLRSGSRATRHRKPHDLPVCGQLEGVRRRQSHRRARFERRHRRGWLLEGRAHAPTLP